MNQLKNIYEIRWSQHSSTQIMLKTNNDNFQGNMVKLWSWLHNSLK